jgi:hypothetical protein
VADHAPFLSGGNALAKLALHKSIYALIVNEQMPRSASFDYVMVAKGKALLLAFACDPIADFGLRELLPVDFAIALAIRLIGASLARVSIGLGTVPWRSNGRIGLAIR